MNKTLAQGHKWTLTQEGDRVYLSLVSEYGTVEFLAKDVSVLRMLEKIAREYDRLKEQGPIVQVVGEDEPDNPLDADWIQPDDA